MTGFTIWELNVCALKGCCNWNGAVTQQRVWLFSERWNSSAETRGCSRLSGSLRSARAEHTGAIRKERLAFRLLIAWKLPSCWSFFAAVNSFFPHPLIPAPFASVERSRISLGLKPPPFAMQVLGEEGDCWATDELGWNSVEKESTMFLSFYGKWYITIGHSNPRSALSYFTISEQAPLVLYRPFVQLW